MPFISIGERLLTTLWVGSLWSIGYLAVPVLFATLDDRMLAGMLAGRMFTIVSFIGLVCGGVLILTGMLRSGWRVWLILGMLLLVAIGEFVLQPMLADLKAQGLAAGSPQAARFGRLHGVSSLLYLLTSLGGLVLVAFGGAGREELRAGK